MRGRKREREQGGERKEKKKLKKGNLHAISEADWIFTRLDVCPFWTKEKKKIL